MIANTKTYLTISIGDYYTGTPADFTVTCMTQQGQPVTGFDGTVTKVTQGLFNVAVILPVGDYILSVANPSAFASTMRINIAVTPQQVGPSTHDMMRELWQLNGLDVDTYVAADDLKRTISDKVTHAPIMVQEFTDDGVTDTMARLP